MITITSDGAKKLLDTLEKEKSMLYNEISDLATFIVATTESVDELRPEFDLEDCLQKLDEIDRKVLIIRHARNIFNTTTKLASGLTIDQALVKLAQLNNRLGKYDNLASKQPKSRVSSYNSQVIEYRYTNYDISAAKERYKTLTEEIHKLQEELNVVNATVVFEINL